MLYVSSPLIFFLCDSLIKITKLRRSSTLSLVISILKCARVILKSDNREYINYIHDDTYSIKPSNENVKSISSIHFYQNLLRTTSYYYTAMSLTYPHCEAG